MDKISGYRRIKSLIGDVANGIDRLITEGRIEKRYSIALYGLDRYSFAMRTILEHRGIEVDCYVLEDEADIITKRREIRDFTCRFLRSDRDVIDIFALDDYVNDVSENEGTERSERVLLIADNDYENINKKLQAAGLSEDKDFLKVTDFTDDDISEMLQEIIPISIDEMKSIEKKILIYIDRFCIENGLRYWVCGGTLLGTIRHKGFIPWDDDIDIFLPLPDYMRFVESFPVSEDYEMIGYGVQGKENPIEMFSKVIDKNTLVDEDTGVLRKISYIWVDVFPLIGLPNDEKERRLFFRNYRETEKSAWQDFYTSDGSLDVFEPWFRKQVLYLNRYPFESAEYVGVVGTKYWVKDFTSKKVYDKTLRMPFEDIDVNVPDGFDEYLKNLYGIDYMNLPPEEQRVSVHKICAYSFGTRDKS